MTTFSRSEETCPRKELSPVESVAYQTEWELHSSMQAFGLSPVPFQWYQACSGFESGHFAGQRRLKKSDLLHDALIKKGFGSITFEPDAA